jgi:hypothetical protein
LAPMSVGPVALAQAGKSIWNLYAGLAIHKRAIE